MTRVAEVAEATPLWLSSRMGLAIIAFLGFINVYAIRVNLSVAIVCMVNQTYVKMGDGDVTNTSLLTSDAECGGTESANSTTEEFNELGGTFEWDKTTQGTILGSFFWGYLVGQVPAGMIAVRFGGKWVYAVTMVISSIATILTPLLAEIHFVALIVVRVILGFFTGMTFPAMHTMWGKWAPPMERTKLMTFTYAGAQVGIVVGFPLSGMLCKYGFAGGWPSVFYVTGGLSLLWSIAWMLLVSESPAKHKRISSEEKEYIMSSLNEDEDVDEDKKKIKVPWCQIMTSMPVYAIIVANITSDWGAYTLLTNIPTYINEVLKFDITSNGFVSALPYIAFWMMINAGGNLADYIRERELLSTVVTRKIFNTVGKVFPALMLVALGYVDCSQPSVAIALLVLSVSLTGAQYSGFLVNHVDIAPVFSGILFGISNSLAAVTGFISPVVVGVITDERQTRAEWQVVFYIAAGIYIFGAIFFILFARGELQPWGSDDPKQYELQHKVDEKEAQKMIHDDKTTNL